MTRQALYGLSVTIAILLAQSSSLCAYELRTHEEITRRAYEISQGVTSYLATIEIRNTDTFDLEARTVPRLLGGFDNTGTARDWVIEGVIREDDYKDEVLAAIMGCPRPINMPTDASRVLNHFFDVQRGGGGLTVPFSGEVGLPAPNWALGVQGRGAGPKQNQFSVLDARDYQHLALTSATPGTREQNTARVFRTLGHVLHLLEDVAQPQHTRNDPHAGCSPVLNLVAGAHSWYEHYVEDRATRRIFRWSGEIPPAIVLEGYKPVPSRQYVEFFADSQRRGMADFSSRNFLTAGTNLEGGLRRCGGLVEPPCEVAAYVPVPSQPFTSQTLKGPVSGTVTFYTRDVFDALTEQVIPRVPLASRSVWDQHLQVAGRDEKFTLNRFNYDAMADILLPRAVGYAAGLLDAFFRGRLDGKLLPPQTAGSLARVRIINPVSNNIGRPSERMTGTFEVFYDAADGTRVPIGQWQGQDLAPGASLEVTLADAPSGSPPPAEPGRYLLVFRGQLGSEPDAVAAVWLDGRVWTLSLGVTAYERDWTVISPPFMTPQTFPAGPTYSHALAAFDSTMTFEGGYSVRPSVVHERSMLYPYTCQGPDYAPVLLDTPLRGDRHHYTAIYRGPAVAWGDQAALSVSGHGATENLITPVVIEVVRFVAPESVEELQSYTYDNPPVVDVILYEKETSSQSWVDVGPIALNGATFIGVRVRPLPEYNMSVPETHRGSLLDTLCFRSLLRYGDLPILGVTGFVGTSVGAVELRIPIGP